MIMTIAMRTIYGYWPWQRRPKETMQENVEKVFREQLVPFSEKDKADETESQRDSKEGLADTQEDGTSPRSSPQSDGARD